MDISDPTEWLDTLLSSLAPVDAAVRCQVCKDFYTTPMLTSCSHTFCSICIRRCLASDGRCPTCRASEQEVRLRRNWAVDEIVDAFRSARGTVLAYGKQGREDPRGDDRSLRKRKLDDVESSDIGNASPQKRKTRSQSRKEADGEVASEGSGSQDQAQEGEIEIRGSS